MELSFSKRISVPENVLFRQLDDESVILHLDNEIYYGLDEVGTRMWTALTESENIQAAFNVLIDEFDVKPDTLQKDLGALIEKLLTKGLLEIQNS